MRRFWDTAWVAAAVLLATLPAAAKEFYVGEPVVQNDMQIVPHYLLGIEMAPMTKSMDMGPNAVHLEVDVHATKDDKRGFKEDEWIPYLTISYTIEKVGTKFKKTGKLLAMTAGDGPHYANNVVLIGDGDYRLTFTLNRRRKPALSVMSTRKPVCRIGGSHSRRPGPSISRARNPPTDAAGHDTRYYCIIIRGAGRLRHARASRRGVCGDDYHSRSSFRASRTARAGRQADCVDGHQHRSAFGGVRFYRPES